MDNVIISADAMKKELFYVAASRGRSEIAVVTGDRELLRESVGVSTARQSANGYSVIATVFTLRYPPLV